MKRPWHFLTVGDSLILALLLLASLAGVLWSFSVEPGQQFIVTDGEQVLYLAPLSRFGRVDVQGPLGTTRLVVDAQGVRISDAPCPLKLCMQMGPVRQVGELIACVPNRILVQVEGGPHDGAAYDLLSR